MVTLPLGVVKVRILDPVGAAADAVMVAVKSVPALLIWMLLMVNPEPPPEFMVAPVRFCPTIVTLTLWPATTDAGVMLVIAGAVVFAAGAIIKVNVFVAVWLPETTVTVTIAPEDEVATVGVPEITPVVELIAKPAGKPVAHQAAVVPRLLALKV